MKLQVFSSYDQATNTGVHIYHNDKLINDFGAITDTISDDNNIITLDIHNDTLASMTDISLKANFPIDSAEGPDTIMPGAKGQITFSIDVEKLLFLNFPQQPNFTLKYKLSRVIGDMEDLR